MTMLEHALAKGPRWMPLVVLLCGLLSTLGAWYALSAIQEKAADREFQQLGNEVLEAIAVSYTHLTLPTILLV